MYIRPTGEHAPATIISCSTCGEDFIHLKYMRNGHEIERHAPFDCVLFPIHSPSPSPGFRDMLSFGTTRRAVASPCLSTRTRSDRHFPNLAGACARGGGGLRVQGEQHILAAARSSSSGRQEQQAASSKQVGQKCFFASPCLKTGTQVAQNDRRVNAHHHKQVLC